MVLTRSAGAAAGLSAGAFAATVYCLHCPEVSAIFVLTWYSFGILLAAGIGSLLGGAGASTGGTAGGTIGAGVGAAAVGIPAVAAGKQSLVLLPEIALTEPFLKRFHARFGCEPVAWHSDLRSTQRRRAWRAIATVTGRK